MPRDAPVTSAVRAGATSGAAPGPGAPLMRAAPPRRARAAATAPSRTRATSSAVRVRSAARSRSENASDLRPAPTCSPVKTSNSATSSASSPAPSTTAARRVSAGTSAATTNARSSFAAGNPETGSPGRARPTHRRRAPSGRARTPRSGRAGRRSPAPWGAARPRARRPSRRRARRAQRPGWNGARAVSATTRTASSPQTGAVRDQACRVDRVRPVRRTAGAPPARPLATTDQDARDVARLRGERGLDRGEVVVGGRTPPGSDGAAGAPGRGCVTSPTSNTATSASPRPTLRRVVSRSVLSTSVRIRGGRRPAG